MCVGEIWNLKQVYMMVILLPTFIFPLSGQSHKGVMRCLDYKTQKFSLEDSIKAWLDIILLRLNNAGNIIMNDTQQCLQMNNAEIFLRENCQEDKNIENCTTAALKSHYNIETGCIICHMEHDSQ